MRYPERIAPEPSAQEVPRCPKHPAEPQVQCSPDSKRAGQYLGACKVCMAERKVGRKAGEAKEKMTAAVARDLGIVPKSVCQIDSPSQNINVQEEKLPIKTYPLSAVMNENPSAPPELACKNHPDRLAQIDALGRNMRLCPECVSERGRKAAEKNREQGVTGAPFSIPLNAGKWAELKQWLVKEAEENERTLQGEVMYRLKLAMREANHHE